MFEKYYKWNQGVDSMVKLDRKLIDIYQTLGLGPDVRLTERWTSYLLTMSRVLITLFSIWQPQIPEEQATHFDKVAMYSNQKLFKLLQGIPEYLAGRKVMSAFVIQNGKFTHMFR